MCHSPKLPLPKVRKVQQKASFSALLRENRKGVKNQNLPKEGIPTAVNMVFNNPNFHFME